MIRSIVGQPLHIGAALYILPARGWQFCQIPVLILGKILLIGCKKSNGQCQYHPCQQSRCHTSDSLCICHILSLPPFLMSKSEV